MQAERPFRDFPKLMQLQEVNGLSFGQTYRNSTQCRAFVNLWLRKSDQPWYKHYRMSSVCMDSSTDTAVIEEEMVQVRYLENNLPVYRSVHVLSFQSFKNPTGTFSPHYYRNTCMVVIKYLGQV